MAQYQTYTVKPGDLLSKIAADNATTVGELVALNGLSDPNRSSPGQVLNIRRTSKSTYVVRRGDSLWAIAKHYGVTVADLARESGIEPADTLEIGQTLTIPDQGQQPTFPAAVVPPSGAV